MQRILIGGMVTAALVLSACSSRHDSSGATELQTGQLGCTAVGRLVSGDPAAANSTVTVADIVLTMFNGGAGPYEAKLGNLRTAYFAASTHTFTGTFSVATGASGGITGEVRVVDLGRAKSTSCRVTTSSSSSTGSPSMQMSASPSTQAAAGSWITLTATPQNVASPRVTFSWSSQAGGVTMESLSSTSARFLSTGANTVWVTTSVFAGNDTSPSASVTTTLTFVGGGSSGASSIQVVVSPSGSVAPGTPVSLTASASGASYQSFGFALASPQSGVSLVTQSATQATFTSSVPGTHGVWVTLPAINNHGVSLTQWVGITVTGSVALPWASLSASPSASGTVGTAITVTATSNLPSPTYSFYEKYVSNPLTWIQHASIWSGTASVSASAATSVVIGVTVVGSDGRTATAEMTLSFGAPASSALTCTLWHIPGLYWVGDRVDFFLTSNTGEPLAVTYWEPGEPWSIVPTFPLYPPLWAVYEFTGYKSVRVIARSVTRPTEYCNGGAYLVDGVTIY